MCANTKHTKHININLWKSLQPELLTMFAFGKRILGGEICLKIFIYLNI